jgi:hypothetical protein
MAMYRTLKDRPWITSAAAEGWAHFAGSVVVDRVFAAKGPELWSPAYDYGKDGSPRLDAQLAAKSPSDVTRAAAAWRELEAVVGRRGFAKLFAQWQQDRPKTPDALLASAAAAFPDKKPALAAWWSAATVKLFFDPPPDASAEKKVTAQPSELSGKPVELHGDDGTADDRRSIGGGGHARRFAQEGAGEWFLTSVSVHGARYGPRKAPDTQFDVALCDAEMHVVATWSFPYSSFAFGEMEWTKIPISLPTRVPAGGFHVCLDFHPTATNGVYVAIDTSSRGASSVATPGRTGKPLETGDWMIRATIDRRPDRGALGEK